MTKEALKLALEALKWNWGGEPLPTLELEAITAIEQALALPEQEPAAWLHTKIEGVAVPHRPADLDKHPDRWEALYKTPPPCPTCEALARTVMLDQTYHDNISPQRTWVGLTDEEIDRLWSQSLADTEGETYLPLREFARAIEAAHGIKGEA